MTTTAFKVGDRVWFTSKYGDRVTGTYASEHEAPGLSGDIVGHIVVSDNAFGADSPKGVHCFVPDITALHHEE